MQRKRIYANHDRLYRIFLLTMPGEWIILNEEKGDNVDFEAVAKKFKDSQLLSDEERIVINKFLEL